MRTGILGSYLGRNVFFLFPYRVFQCRICSSGIAFRNVSLYLRLLAILLQKSGRRLADWKWGYCRICATMLGNNYPFGGIFRLVSHLSAEKTSGFFLCLFVFSAIFAENWFHADIHLRELKGNRVKVPNSPAAVKLHSTFRQLLLPLVN